MRRGRQLLALGKDLTDGHVGPVCLPPTEDRLFRGRETLTTENRVTRKEENAGPRSFLPGGEEGCGEVTGWGWGPGGRGH